MANFGSARKLTADVAVTEPLTPWWPLDGAIMGGWLVRYTTDYAVIECFDSHADWGRRLWAVGMADGLQDVFGCERPAPGEYVTIQYRKRAYKVRVGVGENDQAG